MNFAKSVSLRVIDGPLKNSAIYFVIGFKKGFPVKLDCNLTGVVGSHCQLAMVILCCAWHSPLFYCFHISVSGSYLPIRSKKCCKCNKNMSDKNDCL